MPGQVFPNLEFYISKELMQCANDASYYIAHLSASKFQIVFFLLLLFLNFNKIK